MGEERSLSPFAVALRQARISRGLTIADASRETLLSDKQLLGLENDDYSYFYNVSFARRSAVAYAAFLSVNPALEGVPPKHERDPLRLAPSTENIRPSRRALMSLKKRSRSFGWIWIFAIAVLAYSLRSCEMAREPASVLSLYKSQPVTEASETMP